MTVSFVELKWRSCAFGSGLRPLLAAEERGERDDCGEQDEQTSLHFEPPFLVPAACYGRYEEDRIGG